MNICYNKCEALGAYTQSVIVIRTKQFMAMDGRPITRLAFQFTSVELCLQHVVCKLTVVCHFSGSLGEEVLYF